MAKRTTYEASWKARHVSATDAAKNFGELVDHVREAGVAYVVERKGRPMAQVSPVRNRRCTWHELTAWFSARQASPEEFVTEVRRHVKAANRPQVPTSRWQP